MRSATATRAITTHRLAGIAIAIPLSFCSPCVLLLAEPSEAVQRLIETPASAFDLYLFRLHQACNGKGYFGGAEKLQSVSLFELSYDPGTDTLNLGMHVLPTHEAMKGWAKADQQQKRDILMTTSLDLAISLGLEPWKNLGERNGAIQFVPIRNGWKSPVFDEEQVKEAIADCVVLEVIVPTAITGDEFLHCVTRSKDGQFQYTKREPIQLD